MAIAIVSLLLRSMVDPFRTVISILAPGLRLQTNLITILLLWQQVAALPIDQDPNG